MGSSRENGRRVGKTGAERERKRVRKRKTNGAGPLVPVPINGTLRMSVSINPRPHGNGCALKETREQAFVAFYFPSFPFFSCQTESGFISWESEAAKGRLGRAAQGAALAFVGGGGG